DTKVVVKEVPKTSEYNGVTFEDVTANIRQRLQLEGGASIISVDTAAWIEAGAKEGFIVTRAGRTKITNASDLVDTLRLHEGQEVSILGVYPNGQRSYFDLDL